jgi:hypothetical protein
MGKESVMINRIKDIAENPGKNGRATNGVNGHAPHGAANGQVTVPASPPIAAVPDGQVAGPPIAEGRRRNGTFAPGNCIARGNPFARRLAANRQAILDCTSAADVQDVIHSMRDAAKQGDTAAATVFLSYAVGRPTAAPDPDKLDLQELQMLLAGPTVAEAMHGFSDTLDPGGAAALLLIGRLLNTTGGDKAIQAFLSILSDTEKAHTETATRRVQRALEVMGIQGGNAEPAERLEQELADVRTTRVGRSRRKKPKDPLPTASAAE